MLVLSGFFVYVKKRKEQGQIIAPVLKIVIYRFNCFG